MTMSPSQQTKSSKSNTTPSRRPMNPPPTAYCYRHHPNLAPQPMDDLTDKQAQKTLASLTVADQASIRQIWSIFAAAPTLQRNLILQGLLSQCCFPQLSNVATLLKDMIRIDFISALPTEIAFKILCYLDTTSLTKAAQVSRAWRQFADDDVVWHRMCEQHIDKKCTKCGWGLPLLEKKRLRDSKRAMDQRAKRMRLGPMGAVPLTSIPAVAAPVSISNSGDSTTPTTGTIAFNNNNAVLGSNSEDHSVGVSPELPATPLERYSDSTIRSPIVVSDYLIQSDSHESNRISNSSHPLPESQAIVPSNSTVPTAAKTRPWKDVYSERWKVESNWRHGRYKLTEFRGHTDGIMCLQFDHQYLITGSYDTTVKVWDIETGELLRTLTGHVRGVRALAFDATKLITGSMDKTIRIWNYRTGACICTFRGHEDGVVSLDFDGKLIASGSADTTIKVWNFDTKSCFTLRGHCDWVNSVKIHSASNTLYSASDDSTIRMWDLETKKCIKVFGGPGSAVHGHIGQVQTVIPMILPDTTTPGAEGGTGGNVGDITISNHETNHVNTAEPQADNADALASTRPTHLLTSSLDNTIKLWDITSGECVRTLFGHVEGVWGIAADNFRIVSGAHDKLVKIWDVQSGRCWHTFSGHTAPVSCVGISDSRFCSASEDGVARMYRFDIDPSDEEMS
ncbi:WD40 repeat-like protein [Nadsonia fulvescens var. elongata DSM 6958]|uniref:WD40 repeat-like protein n=1 Tax=Nadsonia fulvescens var. elongata DSM 6958 TaxID=857566 RepID=A0A1E3PCN4_9ASCO|nr:WD40 repeat-like protein [Nadsonia fulvescens var. elongata DSM 6958]